MKYIGQFKDIKDNTIKVEIVTATGGEDQEITIADDGVEINYECSDIFKPIKKSGATIDIYTESLNPDFFTGELLNPKVYIYRNNSLFWFGYLQPNVYNQPFVHQKELLSLECIDTLANLANMNYTYVTGPTSVVKFIDIIKHVLDLTDPTKVIKSIYCQNSISVNSTTNVLDELAAIERNFSDEIDDIMKGDEVLEEICKFLGLCMFQYKDAYYIVDYNHLDSGFTLHQRDGSATNALSATPISISSIGVGAADASISLDGLYNQITIIANTLKSSNPIDSSNDSSGATNTSMSLFGNLVNNNTNGVEYETKDIWVNTNVDRGNSELFMEARFTNLPSNDHYNARKANVWDTVEHAGWTHYKVLSSWFKLDPSKWDYQQYIRYIDNTSGYSMNTINYSGTVDFDYMIAQKDMNIWPDGDTNKWGGSTLSPVYDAGMMVQKIFVYDVDNVPSSYEWKTYLTIPLHGYNGGIDNYFLRTTRQLAPMKGGSLIISFDFLFTANNNIAAPSVIPEQNSTYESNTEKKIVWPAKLSIGDKYWNGNEWKTYDANFLLKLQAGYFEYDLESEYYEGGIEVTGRVDFYGGIYKIWNSRYNDWDYVTKSEYLAFDGTKEMTSRNVYEDVDGFGNGNGHYWFSFDGTPVWYIRRNGALIQVDEAYQRQWVSDRFWLAFRAKNGEQRYGTTHTLNNTSSYELRLAENATGVSILLPHNETFSGDFKFQIGLPRRNNFDALAPGAQCGRSGSFGVMHISDLYIKYSPIDDSGSVFEEENTNNDITYTNVIVAGMCQPHEDVTLKLNTYNSRISSYSYVLDKNEAYIDNILYDTKSQKQEQHLIDKYVSHFSTPKIKYSGTLHDLNITPCSIIYQTQLNKNLAVYKTKYHLARNTVEVESTEI